MINKIYNNLLTTAYDIMQESFLPPAPHCWAVTASMNSSPCSRSISLFFALTSFGKYNLIKFIRETSRLPCIVEKSGINNYALKYLTSHERGRSSKYSRASAMTTASFRRQTGQFVIFLLSALIKHRTQKTWPQKSLIGFQLMAAQCIEGQTVILISM